MSGCCYERTTQTNTVNEVAFELTKLPSSFLVCCSCSRRRRFSSTEFCWQNERESRASFTFIHVKIQLERVLVWLFQYFLLVSSLKSRKPWSQISRFRISSQSSTFLFKSRINFWLIILVLQSAFIISNKLCLLVCGSEWNNNNNY